MLLFPLSLLPHPSTSNGKQLYSIPLTQRNGEKNYGGAKISIKKHHSSKLLVQSTYIFSYSKQHPALNAHLQASTMSGWQKRKNSTLDSILAQGTACFRHLDTTFATSEGHKLVT